MATYVIGFVPSSGKRSMLAFDATPSVTSVSVAVNEASEAKCNWGPEASFIAACFVAAALLELTVGFPYTREDVEALVREKVVAFDPAKLWLMSAAEMQEWVLARRLPV